MLSNIKREDLETFKGVTSINVPTLLVAYYLPTCDRDQCGEGGSHDDAWLQEEETREREREVGSPMTNCRHVS